MTTSIDFIVAKVRGMRGKLYENDRLAQLCTAPSVEDLAATLAPDVPVGDTIALQRHLTAEHVAALYRILSGLGGAERDLFLWMLRRYQVENLKVLLRCWATGAGARIDHYMVELPEPLRLPRRELIDAAGLEALIERVPEPTLRDGALLGVGEHEESGRLFFVEAGLDQAYFRKLRDLASAIHGAAAPTVMKLVLLELDVYNVLFTLRAVFNYAISFNKIRHLLAPFGPHAGRQVLDEVRNAPDVAAAVAAVPEPLVGGLDTPGLEAVEAAMWTTLYRRANRCYYTSVLDFGAVAAFYYIKRVELANLIRVSEHIRYGEHGDAIRKQLIALPAASVAGSGA